MEYTGVFTAKIRKATMWSLASNNKCIVMGAELKLTFGFFDSWMWCSEEFFMPHSECYGFCVNKTKLRRYWDKVSSIHNCMAFLTVVSWTLIFNL